MRAGRWTRREFLEALAAAAPGIALGAGAAAAGCGAGDGGTAGPGGGTGTGTGTATGTGAGTASSAAGAATGTGSGATAAGPPAEPLPENVRETLRAAVARLLPADEDPGALELGAFEYLEAQLATPTFSALHRTFVFGGVTLDRLALMRGGARFHTLEPAVQDDVLLELAHGVDLKRDLDTREFFVKLLNFTVEGCLAPPRYGGNRDGLGWKMVGFDPRHG
ncbi:MAG TPA: gluconate 2-dehydrogenase subunit 3 family protein [Myxococcota bacterium]|jgi:gluconate 2-dehydrogenase gamma chain|nr:gluconate 2-dehydrogenase subunit 3 family protein [Myxococcota bacterium]